MSNKESTTPRPGWRELPLRRLLVGIEQGWSPVAEERVAEENEWAVLKLSAVKRGRFIPNECKALPQNVEPDARLEIRQGDVLLTRANTPELVGDACFVGSTIPKRMLSDLIYRLRPHGVDGRFLVYALLGDFTRGQITADARGSSQSMVKVSQGHIRSWTIMLPDEREQRRVADYLDQRTRDIDSLISKQEQLRTLIEERRQAIVVRAVTKGLDPQVPMSDSGVNWIGEIPRTWSLKRTRRVCSLTTGGRDTQDAIEDGPYPFFVRSDTVEHIDTYSFDGEGVLTSGDGAGVGKVFHHHVGKLEFHQRVYLYFNFKDVLGRFFYFYLREHLAKVVLAGNAKSTVDSLRRPMLLDFPVVLPPLAEQKRIVEVLDGIEVQAKAAIAKVEANIARLREYRQALITAAVTGKLDVQSTTATSRVDSQYAEAVGA